MTTEEYTIFPTHPFIKRFVQSFWLLRGDAGTKPYLLPAEPYFDVILSFGSDTSLLDSHGNRDSISGSFIGGLRTGPFLLSPRGPVEYLAIRFYPYGLRPFLNTHCTAVTDAFVELNTLKGKLSDALQHVLDNRLSVDLVPDIERALAGMLRHLTVQPSLSLMESVTRIGAEMGNTRVSALCRQLGCTERQLRREYDRFLGVPPKQFVKISRFSRLLRRIADTKRLDGFAAIACECGYTDQSHMIHECIEFCGMTPSQLIREGSNNS